MSYWNVLPECYADTLLAEMLLDGEVNHQLSIGQVANVMERQFKSRKAVGIIDDDKVKPKSFQTFQLIDNQYSIKKLEYNKHLLLVISPAFETWIYDNCGQVNIDPVQYGFNNINQFKKAAKHQLVHRNQQVKALFNTLIQKKAPGLMQLRTWMEEVL